MDTGTSPLRKSERRRAKAVIGRASEQEVSCPPEACAPASPLGNSHICSNTSKVVRGQPTRLAATTSTSLAGHSITVGSQSAPPIMRGLSCCYSQNAQCIVGRSRISSSRAHSLPGRFR